jgi:hypothetical protein
MFDCICIFQCFLTGQDLLNCFHLLVASPPCLYMSCPGCCIINIVAVLMIDSHEKFCIGLVKGLL